MWLEKACLAMWSSWFPNGIFPMRRNQNANLEKRIRGLFEAKATPKDNSPILTELQNQKNKVKRMSSLYEENIASFNDTNQSCCNGKTPMSTKLQCVPEITSPIIELQSFFDEVERKNGVEGSMQFLINSEAVYIEKMEEMIKVYLREFEMIPALRLKNEDSITDRQKEELFGPIERIYHLHKTVFYPMLISHRDDIVGFAEEVSMMCRENFFNSYLIYAIDEKECEYRRKFYYKFFINAIFTKTGIAYDFSPIQQLARYHLVLIDMLRELNNLPASAEELKAMSRAELDWKSMMDQVYIMRNFAVKNRA